ncbi:MAG: ABC transporter permease [bacterium]
MFKNYLKIALRNLLRQKLYSFINVCGLALGVSCCLLILLFIEHEWSFDKFHTKAGRLFRALEVEQKVNGGKQKIAYQPLPLGPALEQEIPEIEHAVRVFTGGGMVSYIDKHFAENFSFADPAFFKIFDFPLLHGDPGQALAHPNAVVITRRMAEKYFGADNPLGKTLITKNWRGQVDVIVSGVAENPPGNSSIQFDFVMHITQYPNYERNLTRWTNFNGPTYVLLKESAEANALPAKLATLVTKHWGEVRKHDQERGELVAGEDAMRLELQPVTNIHLDTSVGASRELISNPVYSMILAGIAMLVLAIACINFITLAIGRSTVRAKEVGVRKVLGAFRRQLMQQFWGEALLISTLAFVLGLVLAELLLPLFNQFAQKDLDLNRLSQGWALKAMLGLLPVLGLLAGSYPAVFLSRFQPVTVLKGGVKLQRRSILIRVLVVFQFGLAIFLIVCTIFMVRQQHFIAAQNLGYDPEHVIAIDTFGGAGEEGEKRMLRLREALAEHPQQVLGVTGANCSFNKGWDVNRFDHEGADRLAYFYRVDYDYLNVLGIALRAGRNFSRDITGDIKEAVIVNETLVQEFGWQEPVIGRRLSGWNEKNVPGGPVVIGVAKDYHFLSLHEPIKPVILMLDPEWPIGYVLARVGAKNVQATLEIIEEKWLEIAPNTPFDYAFVNEDLQQQYATDLRWQKIITSGAMFAVVLACLGLFGLATLAAGSRTKEIGIRKVLGASITSLARLLSTEFAVLVLIANTVAWPAAYFAMKHWLENFAYRIDMGWWVFALGGGLALFIALLTVSTQAVKAALANPVEALRYE